MLQSGDRLGAFEILGQLGRGGMGEVYRARDSKLKREVALKILPDKVSNDPELLARFQREAELLAAVNHPNIAAIHSVGEAQHHGADIRFLELELVEGHTLQDRISDGPVPCSEALRITHQIARALQAAHESGIVHRDLKPANVMLTSKGRIKVLDFGIAKPAAMDPTTESGPSDEQVTVAPDLTAAGSLIGTTPYMSPEQIRGGDLDARTDVWALGCLLFEMLGGERAFAGTTAADIMGTIMRGDPEWDQLPREVPDPVVKLIRACLAKDPEARTDSAESVRAALRQVEKAPGRGGPENEHIDRLQPGHTWLPLAAMLAAAAVAVAAWQLATFMGRDPGSAVAPTAGIASLVALPTTLEGAADELLVGAPLVLSTYLAGTPGLRVHFPLPSEPQIESLGGDHEQLARTLNVDALLMTSARIVDGETVLLVTLVDPSTSSLIWGREYAGTVSVEEMLQQAATGLRVALRPDETSAPEPGPNPRAMQYLQVGRVHARNYNHSHDLLKFDRAKAAFDEALSLDPGLAGAAVGLALLYHYRWEAEQEPALANQFQSWLGLAIELDPDSSETLVAQSIWNAFHVEDVLVAVEYAARAVVADPDNALARFALGLTLSGSVVRLALPAVESAAAADPLNLYTDLNIAGIHLWLGQPERARPPNDRLRSRAPDDVFPIEMAIEIAISTGTSPSSDLLEQWRAHVVAGRFPDAWGRALNAVVAMAAAHRAGDVSGIRSALASVRPLISEMGPLGGPEMLARSVEILAAAGLIEEAIGLLRDLGTKLPIPYGWYSTNPGLEPLRAHPEFPAAARAARSRLDGALDALGRLRDRGQLPDYLLEPFDALVEQVRIDDAAADDNAGGVVGTDGGVPR